MLSDLNPTIYIIGGAAIFSILIFFIIMFIFLYQRRRHKHLRERQELQNSFQREILKTQLETQETTFHQISEELHDNIGQLLSSTVMLLGITQRSLKEVPDTLRTAEQTLAKAIQDLRMLSKSLNKEWLHQFNVLENLVAEAERINTANTILITIASNAKSLPLSAESQVMLFRIIQEAIHNSVKHSAAKQVVIHISVEELIRVTITDNGKGFHFQESHPNGVGIMNMKHRTMLLGGTINWKSQQESGTEVSIQIPIQAT